MKKLISLVLVLGMMVSFAACASSGRYETTIPTEKETQMPGETTADPKPYNDAIKLYADLVRDFKKLIAFRLSGQFNDSWYENILHVDFSDTFHKTTEALGELEYRWDCMIIELIGGESTEGPADFGFALLDLNQDDLPELFWVRNDHSIVAAFTYRNGEAVLLDAYWSRYSAFISQDGKLYSWGSGGAADKRCGVYSLTAEGVLVETYAFSGESDWENNAVNYFEYVEGIKTAISAQRYEELTAAYPYEQSDFWMHFAVMPLE